MWVGDTQVHISSLPSVQRKTKTKLGGGKASFKMEIDQNREDSSEAPNGDCLGCVR